jgi:hypothetical protein
MSWPTRKQEGTKHSMTCARAFSHRDMTCPRCLELANGAAPRAGWSDNKRKAEAMRLQAIREHFEPGGRYSRMTETEKMMDTAFEW